MARVDTTVENAPVERLRDVPVDDVIATIDQPVSGYRELYYRWERQQWEAGAIDLTEDRRQWEEDLDPATRASLLWWVAPFYVGEEQVTNSLVPFVDAAPTEEQGVFLTTQLVDEARHTVFLDRFLTEVASEGGDDMGSRLARQSHRLEAEFRRLLLEELPAVADRIRSSGDEAALVEGVVLYHLMIEGVLALAGQRFLLNFLRERDLLPGFRSGFTALTRDESRHVSFGVLFLRDMVAKDVRFERVVRDAVVRFGPQTLAVVDPNSTGEPFDPLPYGPGDVVTFARESLQKRLRSIGVDVAV